MHMLLPQTICFALLVLSLFANLAHSAVRLPAIFGDRMVLQQEMSIPVWGWADSAEEVTLNLGGQTRTCRAAADGAWRVTFDRLAPGATVTLTVQGKNTLTIEDVLVGEVWLCSGQSNMVWPVSQSNDFENEQSSANYPQIRVFTVARNPQPDPQLDCQGKWEICTPDTVGKFSAVAYFFGRDLHMRLNRPVGLVVSAVGGTPIEAWTSLEAQQTLPEYPTIAEDWTEAKAAARYAEQIAGWDKRAAAAMAAGLKPPLKPVDPRWDPDHPANLFNGMIVPLVSFSIRGAIWYQGESNAVKSFANLYGLQLATMIGDWHTRWGYEFPFGIVQLPEFFRKQTKPVEPSGRSLVREGMLKTLRLPQTGMAVTLGLGDAEANHPKNKQDVGKRLAMWALADVYRVLGVASCGPLPAGHVVSENEITVSFKHTNDGLTSKDGPLKGFAIANDDRRWVAADAKIEGDTVVVFSPSVKKPIAVRYGWANNPDCNLFNGAGLPASPFRTDDWKP
jgi:sialate O-acetylesterase